MTPPIEDLISRWETVAKSVERYSLTLDDYLNDLDLRDAIDRRVSEQRLDSAELQSRLDDADALFRGATVESTQSLWGATAGADHRATRQWWYFRYPAAPKGEMRHDLEAAGVLPRRTRRPAR